MKASAFDPEDLGRFLRGELPPEGRRRVIRHLLARARAVPVFSEVSSAGLWPAAPRHTAYDHDIRLSENARRLLRERSRVEGLLQLLEPLSPAQRRRLVRGDRRFCSLPLGQRLVELCFDSAYSDTAKSRDLAELAIALGQELDQRQFEARLVYDFRARSWACLGEVFRQEADLRSADEALDVAEGLLALGSGDVLEEAGLMELRAVLRRDQRRLEEAHGLLDDVLAVYRQFRDFHLVARALVHKGSVYGAANDFEPAIRWLRKGLGLIDPTRERRLDLSARHSLMLFLHESGRDREAWFLLKASRPEFLEHGGELLELRLRWLEGKIQQALGHLVEAEEAFVEARRGLVRQGAGFSAAQVCLDLAALYAGQSRSTEMRSLAEEMLPIFQARDIHREAIAALIVFRQAVRMEKLSTGLLEEIRSYMHRARTDQKLRFESQVFTPRNR